MNEHDHLNERGNALEDLFFAKHDQELIKQHREKRQHLADREQLTAASGISNEAVLDAVLATGVRAETFQALTLFPTVAVAWADGTIDDRERTAVLKAAGEAGVGDDSETEHLLERWLAEEPGTNVRKAWQSTIDALRSQLDEEVFAHFRDEVLERAKKVAQSAGGYLGLMSISAAEDAELNKLAKAMSGEENS